MSYTASATTLMAMATITFSRAVPTSENIISVIESRLKNGWRSEFPGEWPQLEGIRLQETRKNRFELRS
jgi:hypothetical protein